MASKTCGHGVVGETDYECGACRERVEGEKIADLQAQLVEAKASSTAIATAAGESLRKMDIELSAAERDKRLADAYLWHVWRALGKDKQTALEGGVGARDLPICEEIDRLTEEHRWAKREAEESTAYAAALVKSATRRGKCYLCDGTPHLSGCPILLTPAAVKALLEERERWFSLARSAQEMSDRKCDCGNPYCNIYAVQLVRALSGKEESDD